MLLCDVDELKAINDESGHDAGDRALQRVAEALVAAAAARPGNLVGRLSGDEFCVVMEGATLEDARELAGATLANLEQEDGGVLISCGAAALGRGVDDPRRADARRRRRALPGQAQRRRPDLHGRVAGVRTSRRVPSAARCGARLRSACATPSTS